LWTGVGDRAAESDIIANEVLARGILELVLYIRLFDLEVSVNIAAIVRLPAFRHLLMLRLWVLDYAPFGDSRSDIGQTPGPATPKLLSATSSQCSLYRSTNSTR
jgi:hypothetical protein